jgi:hypothetical protein
LKFFFSKLVESSAAAGETEAVKSMKAARSAGRDRFMMIVLLRVIAKMRAHLAMDVVV